MSDITLLFIAIAVVFFTGVMVGIHAEHHAEHGTLAQRRRAVRAEERLADLERTRTPRTHSPAVTYFGTNGEITDDPHHQPRHNARAAARLDAMNGATQ